MNMKPMKQVQWMILAVGLSYCTTPTTPSDHSQHLASEQSKSTDKSQNTLSFPDFNGLYEDQRCLSRLR